MSKTRSSLGEKAEKTTSRGRRLASKRVRKAGRAGEPRGTARYRRQAPQWEGWQRRAEEPIGFSRKKSSSSQARVVAAEFPREEIRSEWIERDLDLSSEVTAA